MGMALLTLLPQSLTAAPLFFVVATFKRDADDVATVAIKSRRSLIWFQIDLS